MFYFYNSAKTFALHGKTLVPYLWGDSQNFLLEKNALKETFREKNSLSLAIIYHQKQLKDKVWKTPWPCRPFFCEIEKQLLEEMPYSSLKVFVLL